MRKKIRVFFKSILAKKHEAPSTGNDAAIQSQNHPRPKFILAKKRKESRSAGAEVYEGIHEAPSTGNDAAIQSQNEFRERIRVLLEEIKQGQEQVVLKVGRHFVPTLTTEDVLQPNDYQELENNPCFRYEEGVLAGIHTVRMALLALFIAD